MKLPEWIGSKKEVINPKNNGENCFKWAVIAALHHEEIEKDHQRVFIKYKWNGLEFSLAIQKVSKFERNNAGIAVNVLFRNMKNKNIYTAHRSELNGKRHYTAIKNKK